MIMPMTLLEAGTAADTYLLIDGAILKLFHEGTSYETATQEVAGIRVARAIGISAPIVREVVEYQGRWGIVFERLQGTTMLQVLITNPERAEELGREMAGLHVELHGRDNIPLPSQLLQLHDALRYLIPKTALPERIKTAVLAALDRLPTGTALCHGDLHPHNVMLTPTGPVLLDWADAFISCPATDVAITALLLRYMEAGEDVHPTVRHALDIVRTRFHDAYWQRYGELRPADAAQVNDWMLPVAAIHLTAPASDQKRQTILALIDSLMARPG